MSHNSIPHVIEVWGDFACFSRPELKVERWSYPCPTPSAARGIFDAIFLKPPEFRWEVSKIEILAQPSYIALRRNEVKDKVNLNAVKNWMAGKDEPEPIWADADKSMLGTDIRGRTQRQTMALRDVRYRLHGRIVPWPNSNVRQAALDAQFHRRAAQGKCFQQPYFGCREFVAFFRLIQDISTELPPVSYDQDLGFMLYDVFDLSQRGDSSTPRFISLFKATIRQGILDVPDFESDAVKKPRPPEGRAA